MDLQINLTEKGVLEYPLHRHKNYEIMLYTEGEGVMRTERGVYPFSVGTVIIVPPCIEHGSSSTGGFRNISIGGAFGHLLNLDTVVSLSATEDARTLAFMIYKSRYDAQGYLLSLCNAYIQCLQKSMNRDSALTLAVRRIAAELTEHFCEYDAEPSVLLRQSGFAEDYIRAHFKKITGLTPNEFLERLRMERACYLIELYGNTIALGTVAEKCGYLDYAYFSKKFKRFTGLSPAEYRRRNK